MSLLVMVIASTLASILVYSCKAMDSAWKCLGVYFLGVIVGISLAFNGSFAGLLGMMTGSLTGGLIGSI